MNANPNAHPSPFTRVSWWLSDVRDLLPRGRQKWCVVSSADSLGSLVSLLHCPEFSSVSFFPFSPIITANIHLLAEHPLYVLGPRLQGGKSKSIQAPSHYGGWGGGGSRSSSTIMMITHNWCSGTFHTHPQSINHWYTHPGARKTQHAGQIPPPVYVRTSSCTK